MITLDGQPVRPEDVALGGLLTVFPEGEAGSADGQAVMMRVEPSLLRLPANRRTWAVDGIVAYSKVCTHAGCPVGLYEADTHELLCPCHQSSVRRARGGAADQRTGSVASPSAAARGRRRRRAAVDGRLQRSGGTRLVAMKRAALAIVCAVGLSACSRRRRRCSIAHAPQAHRIADVWWLMFVLAVGVFLIVTAFVVWAIVRRRADTTSSADAERRDRRFVLLGGLVVPTVVLAVVAVATVRTTNALQPQATACRSTSRASSGGGG